MVRTPGHQGTVREDVLRYARRLKLCTLDLKAFLELKTVLGMKAVLDLKAVLDSKVVSDPKTLTSDAHKIVIRL